MNPAAEPMQVESSGGDTMVNKIITAGDNAVYPSDATAQV
jgi:hypothetical protein